MQPIPLCYTERAFNTAKQLCWNFCFKRQKAKLFKECMDNFYYSESYWLKSRTCKKAKTRTQPLLCTTNRMWKSNVPHKITNRNSLQLCLDNSCPSFSHDFVTLHNPISSLISLMTGFGLALLLLDYFQEIILFYNIPS